MEQVTWNFSLLQNNLCDEFCVLKIFEVFDKLLIFTTEMSSSFLYLFNMILKHSCKEIFPILP